MAVANPALYVWLEGQQEREKGHPNPAGSPMGIPIRWEPGNRGKTPDRAVGSPGHLGHLTVSGTVSEALPGVCAAVVPLRCSAKTWANCATTGDINPF